MNRIGTVGTIDYKKWKFRKQDREVSRQPPIMPIAYSALHWGYELAVNFPHLLQEIPAPIPRNGETCTDHLRL